jgi:hypothetical protein
MVNPGDLVAALLAKLQLNADLVRVVGGKQDNLFVYKRNYPRMMSLDDAVYQMPPGSVMLVWEGTFPATLGNRMDVWKNQIGIYIKAKDKSNVDASFGFYEIWDALINGIPVGEGCDGQKMLRTTVHDDFWPMDTPSITPQLGRTPESQEAFEYFKITVSFTQKGD